MIGTSPVSVVIPTQNRPDLLRRAIRSVLSQTMKPDEILVVLDNASDRTRELLRDEEFSTVKVLELECGAGASDARNLGIRRAENTWIAFLDDDDEWLPGKLELQMEAGTRSKWKYPIVCSRMVVRTARGDFVQPLRAPCDGESIDDYLFSRKTLVPGESLLQTSNLLVPRSLAQQTSFCSGLRICEDTDWLLRASTLSGVGLEFVPEVLSVWYTEDKERITLSTFQDCEYVFKWVHDNRGLFSPHGYSGALLVALRLAVEQNHRRTARAVMQDFFGPRNKLTAVQISLFVLLFACLNLVPSKARPRLRLMLRSAFATSVGRTK